MSRPPSQSFETQVREVARALPYPPTPDLTGAWANRPAMRTRPVLRPAWALIVILALLVGLLAVPPVRAAIREFLQIGAVRIWLVEPTPAPTATRPEPTPTSMVSVLQLSGATTLAEAQAAAPFPIRLPTLPADLGEPDHVFLQNLDGVAVILVWMQDDQPDQVRMSLHLLSSDVIAWKMGPQRVTETTVSGQPAVWAEGPYVISLRNGNWEARQLVSGHVLIWQAEGVTYRLESDLPLDEALRVAESLALP
jgi:hypothetical protein